MIRSLLTTASLAVALLGMGGGNAAAREIEVAIGYSIPPYVIPDEQRGMEYDIVKAALAQEGHVMKPNFLPVGRVARALEAGTADAALTQIPDGGLPVHYSDVHITFNNAAITLASRGIKLEQIGDLAGKSVVAFQWAASYLGPRFQEIARGNSAYREETKQAAQPILLFLGRTDVVITDPAIFSWFARLPEVVAKADTSQPIRIHPLFQPTDYRVAFRDPALRDSFNRGLERLRRSGEYARIMDRYLPLRGTMTN